MEERADVGWLLYNRAGFDPPIRKPAQFLTEILAQTLIVLIAIAATLTAIAALYLLVSYLLASGMTRVGEAEFQDSPSDYGATFESVRFMSRRGDVTLDGWYLRGCGGMPTLIFCHGIEIGRTGDGLTELAATLNRRGFGVLQFDFRGHGASGGKRVSSGWHERMDALGAYDYLISRGVSSDEIGLHGVSMGAGAACLAAAEEPRIRALSLDTPYANASEMILRETSFRTRLPSWFAKAFIPCAVFMGRRLYDIDVEGMAPEKAVSQLDYPVSVIYGTEDSRIPPEHSQRVFDASAKGSRLWVVEGVGHAGSFVENKAEYAERVAEYFLSRLCSKEG